MIDGGDGDFTALDIETANNESHSVCEIGVARFRKGNLIETWRTLVDPKTSFERNYHSRLHGIDEHHVVGAPTFPEIHALVKRFINNETCITHGPFDKAGIASACKIHDLEDITASAEWIDTVDLCRQKWPTESSHKLTSLCEMIGHKYVPHNALEDAFASATLYLHICEAGNWRALSSQSPPDAEVRTYRPGKRKLTSKDLSGNSECTFPKTFVVLTGKFSHPWEDRGSFKLYLNDLNFLHRGSFSQKTQYLVTGEDPGPSKIEKAKELEIPVLTEAEFIALVQERL